MPDSVSQIVNNVQVVDLAAAFDAQGYELHLVGGCVRDALLSRPIADIDLTTDAPPDAIERLVSPRATALWTIGREFGTVGAEIEGHLFEITTYRSDVYTHTSRKPEVSFGDSLLEDLRRRDFTINSMAIEVPSGKLIDPFGGVQDLARKRLATPRSASDSFAEDPLRIMRAARFAGRLGLKPDESLVSAMESMRHRLQIVSAERVCDELAKILTLESVSDALWLLYDTGVMAEVLPEVAALRLEQDPIHRHKDVLAHSIAVTEKSSPKLVLRLAALLHDIGKPATRSFSENGVAFHHHDVVGAKMARKRLRALRYPKDVIEAVSNLIFLHLRVHTYRMGWTDSAVRRYVRDAGDQLEDLNELIRCDCTTRNPAKARQLQDRMDELEVRISEVAAKEELNAMRPALDGSEVMERLGVSAGPTVGKALKFLLHVRLEEGEIPKQEAYERLDSWWSEQPAT